MSDESDPSLDAADEPAPTPDSTDDPTPATGPTDDPDPLTWETVESWVAYDCPGFEIVHDEVRLPGDHRTDFDYLSDVPSVVVLPFTSDGDVVVIEEWRQAVGRVNRGLPAGGTEPGDDDLAQAAHRELAEETGYEAAAVEHLVTVEPANGISDAVNHYYVATDCEPTAEQALDHDESIRVATTSYDALRDEVLAGGIRDGRTVLGVCYYELAE